MLDTPPNTAYIPTMHIMPAPPTLRQLINSLATQQVSCESVTAEALRAAKRADSVFIRVNEEVLAEAVGIDRARVDGRVVSVLAGVPITLKDLFNVRGQRTFAGSKVLREDAPIEQEDAELVGYLRAAGALFLGRVNMSEFAFSGMGLNPHYGNPMSIWDRAVGRLPGGSSSGSAVSVAEGIVAASIGSDTAGSCRVPAAFNGIVGVKPTYGRFSLRGVYPLSPTSDAPGPLANDVDGCFILDNYMAGKIKPNEALPKLSHRDAATIRLLLPEDSVVMQGLEEEVAAAFARSLEQLREAGVVIVRARMPALEGCVEMFMTRAVAVFEAWEAHRARLALRGDEYDPFVRRRMSAGANFDADAQQECYREKAKLVADCARQMNEVGVDALVYPTVQCVPPAIAETDNAAHMSAINLKCLRNTATVNFFDGCSVSLPCHVADAAPVGLMLSAGNGDDCNLYEISATVEQILNERRAL